MFTIENIKEEYPKVKSATNPAEHASSYKI